MVKEINKKKTNEGNMKKVEYKELSKKQCKKTKMSKL